MISTILSCLLLGIVLLKVSSTQAMNLSSKATSRAVGKLRPEQCCLLLCDVQERFRSVIYKAETVVNTCRYMTSVADALHIPIVATQQYTKVFGPTLQDCFATPDQLDATPIYEKK